MPQSSNIDVSSLNKGIMPNVDYRYANKGPQIKAVLAGISYLNKLIFVLLLMLVITNFD